jgi:SAM-dependent methyltransferase
VFSVSPADASPELPSLRRAWEHQADYWAAWAETPGHDTYDQFHRQAFLPLVPPPGRRTLDLGCGQGRVSADLVALGHRVIGVDGSPTLAARAHERGHTASVADAASLPFANGSFDCVVSMLVLQDVDHFQAAIAEAARVLGPDGRFVFALVHPINNAGAFADDGEADPPFVIADSYFEHRRLRDHVERDGLVMTFHSEHRPLGAYVAALADAGFVIERLVEPTVPDPADKWARLPMFLDVACRLDRPPGAGVNPSPSS